MGKEVRDDLKEVEEVLLETICLFLAAQTMK